MIPQQPQTLRDYQRKATDAILQNWTDGESAPLLFMATGGGKTTVIAQTLVETVDPRLSRALVLAHREELIRQLKERIEQQYGEKLKGWFGDGFDPGIGVVMADENQMSARIVVATRQSLHKRRLTEVLGHGAFDVLVVDECFPAGTLIEGKPIETYQKGDSITAYDEGQQRFVQATVTDIFRRKPRKLICRVTIGNEQIVCTPNHPFLTRRGWKPAVALLPNDEVYCTTKQQPMNRVQDAEKTSLLRDVSDVWRRNQYRHTPEAAGANETRSRFLQPSMLLRQQTWKEYGSTCASALSLVRQRLFADDETPARTTQKNGARVLFQSLWRSLSRLGQFFGYGRNQSQICFGANENKQPHEEGWSQAENEGFPSGFTVEAKPARGEWDRLHRAAAQAVVSVGVGNGASDLHAQDQRRTISSGVQDRHRGTFFEDSHRSRWQLSQDIEGEGSRSEENGIPGTARVDSVEVFQSDGDDRFGGLCPDGFVYNLEVTPHHTYTVGSGIIVHNCHHATDDNSYGGIVRALVEANPDLKILGVTATPKRQDEKALGSIFSTIAYSWSLDDGIGTGYLSPITHLKVDTQVNVTDIQTRQGDYAQNALVEKLTENKWLDKCIDAYRETVLKSGRSCLVFMPSVEMSREFAALLQPQGVSIAHLDGTTPKDERRKMIADYATGKLQAITNFGVLDEGVDVPRTSAIFFARPTRSAGLMTQIIGRGMRPFPGKVDCLLVNLTVSDPRAIKVGTLVGKMMVCSACSNEFYLGFAACPSCGEPKATAKRSDGAANWEENAVQAMGEELVAAYSSIFQKTFAAWHMDAQGYLSCTLSFDSGALVIAPPSIDSLNYRLAFVPKDRDEKVRWLIWNEDLAGLMEQADEYIKRKGDERLAQKEAGWRGQPITDAQKKLLDNLEVQYAPDISKGAASQLITHTLSVRRIAGR